MLIPSCFGSPETVYSIEGWAIELGHYGGEDMETKAAIEAWVVDMESRNLSDEAIRWYKVRLNKFNQRYAEVPETSELIREFLRDVKGEDWTKHGYFRAVRAFYTFLNNEYGFPLSSETKSDNANPMKKVKAPRVRDKVARSLSLKELHQLLSASNGDREHKWHFRDKVIVSLLSDTAIRASEAVLRWHDIAEETVHVTGKTGEREVPISAESLRMLEKLREWNEKHFGPSPFVFLGKKGRPLTAQGIGEVVERAFGRAELSGPRSSPHTLRHTFGRNWIAEGGDEKTLQKILGHRTSTTVKIYTNLNLRETIRQHRRFSPLVRQVSQAQSPLWDEVESILGRAK